MITSQELIDKLGTKLTSDQIEQLIKINKLKNKGN